MAGFDVFVSYARADNEQGWVTAIRDLLIEDARSHSDRVPNVFLDTSEIHGMQDWKARILGALQSSKVLLICLSPAYLASEYCRWEREEFAAGEVRMRASIGASDEDDGLMAQVFFVDLPRRTRNSARRGESDSNAPTASTCGPGSPRVRRRCDARRSQRGCGHLEPTCSTA